MRMFQDHYPLDRPRLLIKQLERCGKKPPLPKYQTEDAAAMGADGVYLDFPDLIK